MVEPVIEPARPDDLPALLSLYAQLHPDESPPDPARAEAIWLRLIQSPETTVLAARMDGAVAGACTLSITPNLTRGGRPYALIENVVTDEAVRRCGVGTALLETALARAWAADCYKVMLASGSQREETRRFYLSAGFTAGTKTHFEIRRA